MKLVYMYTNVQVLVSYVMHVSGCSYIARYIAILLYCIELGPTIFIVFYVRAQVQLLNLKL